MYWIYYNVAQSHLYNHLFCQHCLPFLRLKMRLSRCPWQTPLHHALYHTNRQPGVDSFTVSLHSLNGRQIAYIYGWARGLSVAFENSENFHQSHEPTIHCDWGNLNLYLDWQNTKGWCQPTISHVSYPTDSPTATRLGLCSSLSQAGSISIQLACLHLSLASGLNQWPLEDVAVILKG